MEKIIFNNNTEPFLSAQTFNQLQDNIENEINGKTGDLSALTTTKKTNLVEAINEANTNGGNNSVILYENEDGSNETITLNDSSENYNYLEIYFKDNVSNDGSVKIYNPNGKNVSLHIAQVPTTSGGSGIYMNARIVTISGNTISTPDSRYRQIHVKSSPSEQNTNNIYITRVIGY